MCRLRKVIYGLKQAHRAWYHALQDFLLEFDFHNSYSNTSFFIYHHHGAIIFLLLYVDNIILSSSCSRTFDMFTCALSTHFLLKDLGDL